MYLVCSITHFGFIWFVFAIFLPFFLNLSFVLHWFIIYYSFVIIYYSFHVYFFTCLLIYLFTFSFICLHPTALCPLRFLLTSLCPPLRSRDVTTTCPSCWRGPSPPSGTSWARTRSSTWACVTRSRRRPGTPRSFRRRASLSGSSRPCCCCCCCCSLLFGLRAPSISLCLDVFIWSASLWIYLFVLCFSELLYVRCFWVWTKERKKNNLILDDWYPRLAMSS